MEEKKWCVYMHTNKINGKKYIGITSLKPVERWGTKGQKYKTSHFYNAIKKYGWDNFTHEILFTELEEQEAKDTEIRLISKYKTKNSEYGYNLTDGGDGVRGYCASEEHRKKISERQKGKTPWNKGKKYNLFANSEIQKIKWQNKDYRQNMVDKNTGKILSEETKDKISKNNPRRRSVYQLDRDTLDVLNKFDCVIDAIRFISGDKFSYNQSVILNVINGVNSYAYGYKWIEANDYENKTDLYYKIINLNSTARSVICLSIETLDIVRKYSYTNELRIEYDEIYIKRIKNNCKRMSKCIFDGYYWCFFDRYEEFKNKVIYQREKKGIKCE